MAGFDFSTFPVLTTPRLILRQMAAGDATDLLKIHGDPEVQKYDSDPPMQDIREAAAAIEHNRQRFLTKKAINWAIILKAEDHLVGGLGFYFWDQTYYKTDLGYSLARAYWRRGITTEALQAVLRFAFVEMQLHRINVDTRMDNIASVRLMQKLGFQHEGTRRECIRNPDGTYQNWGLFGMLDYEYHPSPSPI